MQKQKFDEIISYVNKKVSEMEIETKYKMELLGMVTALGYAHEKETHDKRTETHSCDSISRQETIRIVDGIDTWQAGWRGDAIESIAPPSAQPEIIRCKDCKYYREYGYVNGKPKFLPRCTFNSIYVNTDDFCSKAERKTDE